MKYEIFVFGDSIVFGLNDSEGGWVDGLKSYFANQEFETQTSNKRIVNLGISGDTSQQLQVRFESEFIARWNTNKIPVVIIAIGINDLGLEVSTGLYKVSLLDFQSNLEQIIIQLNKITDSKAKIWLNSILPISPKLESEASDRGFTRSNQDVTKYNQIIVDIAKQNSLEYMDLTGIIGIDSDLDEDGLHPNNLGHTKLFQYFVPRIERF